MSWRDDPDLVRRDGPVEEAAVQLDQRWDRVFALVDNLMPSSGVFDWKATAVKAFVGIARQRAAADPEGTRAQVVQACQLVVAALEIEPAELFQPAGE